MSGAGGVPDDDGGDPYPLPASAAELRERRLAYLAKTHPQVVSVSFKSSEQGKVADPVAAEAPREVVSISSTSSDSSSDGDAPLIKPRDDADVFEVTKAPKRGRGGGPVCPPTPFPSPFAAEYSSVDAVKQALKEKNAACIPRLRSTSGKYVRFSCKHSTSSLQCFLNMSGCRVGSGIRLNASTYVPGDCDNRVCTQCQEVLTTSAQVSCPNNHRFCLECFNHVVLTQVREDKACFIRLNCEVFCKFCSPHATFDMHPLIKCVEKSTWDIYIDARTEGAVVAEQQRLQAQRPVAVDPNEDIAFVANLVCRWCPNCKQLMADDFSGCLSLQCGRVEGHAGGGCGTEFCAYCSEAFASEMLVHQHLDTCAWNPRPGHVFPKDDYKAVVWNIRRYRVWYHVMCNCADKIPAIWNKIASNYSDLHLTTEWVDERERWFNFASEFAMKIADFYALVPRIIRCISTLQDMGFSDDGNDKLFRASIICKADPQQACLTLLANADDE
jgi:hypothetical protein